MKNFIFVLAVTLSTNAFANSRISAGGDFAQAPHFTQEIGTIIGSGDRPVRNIESSIGGNGFGGGPSMESRGGTLGGGGPVDKPTMERRGGSVVGGGPQD